MSDVPERDLRTAGCSGSLPLEYLYRRTRRALERCKTLRRSSASRGTDPSSSQATYATSERGVVPNSTRRGGRAWRASCRAKLAITITPNLSWSHLCLASSMREPRTASLSLVPISRMEPRTFTGHQRSWNGIEVADEERRECVRTYRRLWTVAITPCQG
jgi:hypothetical protein